MIGSRVRQFREHPRDLYRLPLATPTCGRNAGPVSLEARVDFEPWRVARFTAADLARRRSGTPYILFAAADIECLGLKSYRQVGAERPMLSFFSKLTRSVLRHIRVASKQELKDRLIAAVDYFNRDPVVHTWTYKLDKAA
jgi:hypothetical protein